MSNTITLKVSKLLPYLTNALETKRRLSKTVYDNTILKILKEHQGEKTWWFGRLKTEEELLGEYLPLITYSLCKEDGLNRLSRLWFACGLADSDEIALDSQDAQYLVVEGIISINSYREGYVS